MFISLFKLQCNIKENKWNVSGRVCGFSGKKGCGIQAGSEKGREPGGAVLSAEPPVNTPPAPSSDLMVSPSLRNWQ